MPKIESDNGARILHPFHEAPFDNAGPSLQVEWQYQTNNYPAPNFQIEIGRTGGSFGAWQITKASETDPPQGLITGSALTFVIAVQIGVRHVPRMFFSTGTEIIFDTDGNALYDPQETGGNILIANWDLSLTKSAFAKCHAYTTGYLHMEGKPSSADMLACAQWHSIHAPKGQKDVWPGWNKHRAA